MPTVKGDITTEVEIEVEIYCMRCGAGLCKQSKAGNTHGRNAPFIEVEPCEKCLETAKEEGRNEGYSEGVEEATKSNATVAQ